MITTTFLNRNGFLAYNSIKQSLFYLLGGLRGRHPLKISIRPPENIQLIP
jgi:hypothetical protein